jgi:Rieske 2Fe-2S family protein
MDRWVSGFSLPQAEYISPEQFDLDMEVLGRTQWVLLDHASRIPDPGDWFTTEWGGESIIVVRGKDRQIRGFYNVCRHRGSRICLADQGHSPMLTCPYHAWSYGLDGTLKGASLMPEGFDRADNGLHPVHIREFHGLLFMNLTDGVPPSFEEFTSRFEKFLAPHGLERTRIIHREAIPNAANWKLVVENFYECYHCRPSHRTYCSVHDELKLLALGAGPGSADPELVARYEVILNKWEAKAQKMGRVTGMWSDDADSAWLQSASRLPIADGKVTESLDGQPVAPLMGDYTEYDGAQTAAVFNLLSPVLINNDHAVFFRIVPRGPLETDFEAIWLVSENAEIAEQADIDRITALWTITAGEDKTITDDNQKGVLSHKYQPGRYSTQEARLTDFGIWYHRLLGEAEARKKLYAA